MSMADDSGMGSKRAADEAQMADHAQRLVRFPTGWRVVYLHLSNLRAQNRQDHHLRIAAASFEPMIRRFDGRLFRLENKDYAFCCKGAEISDVEAIIEKLRFLFSEDPLTIAGASDGRRFTTWFDISQERDRDTFKALADQLYTRAEERRDKERQNRVIDAGANNRILDPSDGQDMPLTPELLSKLEGPLSRMDIGSLIRRQPVCAMVADGSPKLIFNELFIAMAKLERRIMPGVDIFSDRWLFQRLTQSLGQTHDCGHPGNEVRFIQGPKH